MRFVWNGITNTFKIFVVKICFIVCCFALDNFSKNLYDLVDFKFVRRYFLTNLCHLFYFNELCLYLNSISPCQQTPSHWPKPSIRYKRTHKSITNGNRTHAYYTYSKTKQTISKRRKWEILREKSSRKQHSIIVYFTILSIYIIHILYTMHTTSFYMNKIHTQTQARERQTTVFDNCFS